MSSHLNGFYVAYMASAGYGVVLFIFKDGQIVGVDAGGVKFDGSYSQDGASKSYHGVINVEAPPNIDLIQGAKTGPDGLNYQVHFILQENFLEAPFISVETPFGEVNMKLERLRDLGTVD